jgi:hypothetical protein
MVISARGFLKHAQDCDHVKALSVANLHTGRKPLRANEAVILINPSHVTPTIVDSVNRSPFQVGWFILALVVLSSCGWFRYIPESPSDRQRDSLEAVKTGSSSSSTNPMEIQVFLEKQASYRH